MQRDGCLKETEVRTYVASMGSEFLDQYFAQVSTDGGEFVHRAALNIGRRMDIGNVHFEFWNKEVAKIRSATEIINKLSLRVCLLLTLYWSDFFQSLRYPANPSFNQINPLQGVLFQK